MNDLTQMVLVFTVLFITFIAVQDMSNTGQAFTAESGQAVRVGATEPGLSVIIIGIVSIILLITLFLLWHHDNKYTN